MNAIIIAAGVGSRANKLTENSPKCLLKVNGKSLLEMQIDAFKSNGINNISLVKGYQQEKITLTGLNYYINDNYLNNDVLNSLMYAENEMNDAFIATNSDIIFENKIVEALKNNEDDITVIADTHWREQYEGRALHPISEAEKVVLDDDNNILEIGKTISSKDEPHGEFIGMIKCSKQGAQIFKDHFHLAKTQYNGKPFIKAENFDKAYITDFLTYLISIKINVKCVLVRNGWHEIDTEEDFNRVTKMLNL